MNNFLYVLIYRKRLTFALALTVFGSFVYVFYQVIVFMQIREELSHINTDVPVLGIDPKLRSYYIKKEDGIFQCIRSGELISYYKLNDDYCDCSDGSDEPGTDACPNGEFFCSHAFQFGNYPRKIPSNKVNDRVCDCCDGSDEWKQGGILVLDNKKIVNKLQLCPKPCVRGTTTAVVMS